MLLKVKNKWGMIQCAGSIDGCHIPVLPPALNHTDYYNRKGWYSILEQAVVDHNYLFTDVCVGCPGSVHDHDTRALANSSIIYIEKHLKKKYFAVKWSKLVELTFQYSLSVTLLTL